MPINEVGDRAHNFFAQEHLSQGQYSHALSGDWPLDKGLWVSNQKQIGSPSSNTLSYVPKQPETELRHNNLRFPVPNGFNFMYTPARPEFSKNLSQVQLQSSNGYLYGQHDSQTGPDEANFLGFDTESASMNSRGSLGVSEKILNTNISKGSDACSSLNLFGGQHQMNGRQHSGLLQPSQQKQSGFNDMHHLQQQLMLRKMQEIQTQKHIPQVDTRKHIPINQASDTHSDGLINAVHMGMVHLQSDQSLYGVPVSSSRGSPNMTQQMPTFPVSQYDGIPEQVIIHDGNSLCRQGVQGSNNWINMEQIQQLELNHQTGPDQMFQGSRDEIAQDEPTIVSLDPEEEKFLFGSDENIWDAFGSDRPSNEFAGGLPSIQSGSWSALMQSAVSETCSSGLGLQEEWNLDHPSNYDKQNQWTPVECIPTPVDISSNIIENSGLDGIRRVISLPSSIVDSGPTSSSMGSPHAITPNFSNSESGNHQLSYWKHIESSVKSKGSRNSGKPHHHLNKGSQISESSEDLKMHEIESRRKRESSNDSFQSTSSRQVATAHWRENSLSDAGDLRAFPGTKQHFSNQSGQLSSVQRKFQYHPMGNLDEDVEIPYEKRQATSLQHFQGLRAQDKGNPGHIINSGLAPKSSAEMGKGHVPDLEGVTKVSQIGGYLPNMFASFNRSVGLSTSQKASQPSQNMMDLHYKVDQSRDGTARHLNSTDGSLGGLQKSQSSNSPGFSSQRLPLPHNTSSSLVQAHVTPNLRDTGQTLFPSMPPFQKTPHGGFASNSFGTSLFNSQGLASTREQSTKGSFPQNVLSVKFDQGQIINGPLGKESFTDLLPVNPTSRQMELQTFGCSLKPSNSYQNMDNDPCNRVTKRVKVSDNLDSHNESQSSVPTNTLTYIKAEHSHISPQMAPTWFDKYGTLKNVLSDATIKLVEQPVSVERHSGGLVTHVKSRCIADTSEVGTIWKNRVQPLVAFEQSSLLPTNVGVQNLVTLRPKKRKLTTAGLHPWLVEVSGSFKNLQGICTGAIEWSRATNRVMEKVDDDGDIIEDVQPISRPKSRVVFTTLLMQQLLRPPPAPVPSLDAIFNYESVVYYAARLALGDACNLVSYAFNKAKCISDKSEQSERIDDRRLSKVIEDFTSKSKNLQDAFLSLDKRASILDLRVKFQDLERFSIINCFARFHGRRQADGTETSRPFPQRYVAVVPLPANLPDRVQCLSL